MDVINYILSKKLKKYVDDSVGNVPDEKITEAVNNYLEKNPVAPGATSEQAEQIQDNTNKITELKGDLVDLATFEKHPNIISDYVIQKGAILNNVGSWEANNSYNTFKYGVPVEVGKKYTISTKTGYAPLCKIVFSTNKWYESFETPKAIYNNVNSATCPDGATFLLFSYYVNSSFNENDLIVQEGDYAVDSVSLNNNVKIRRLDDVEGRLDGVEGRLDGVEGRLDATKKNLFENKTELSNMQLNTVGWFEDASGFSTNRYGIKVEPNTWYTFLNSDNDLLMRMKYVSYKTADNITEYDQPSHIRRDSSMITVKSPANAQYLFFTCESSMFSKVKVVEGFSNYNAISNNLWTYGKKLMTLGDSLTEFNVWQPYVLGKLGFSDYINLGVGGTKVNVFADNVTSENIADVDVITIMGLFNSTSSQSGNVDDEASHDENASICANYKYLIDKLLSLKPTVKIILITPHTPRADDVGLKAQAVKDVSRFYKIPCIDVYFEGGFNQYTFDAYLSDAVHSSTLGGEQEGNFICGRMFSILS